MSLTSKLKVLGFCTLCSGLGVGTGEMIRTAARTDAINQAKASYSYSKTKLEKIETDYAFLSPKDISLIGFGAGMGLCLGGLGLIFYVFGQGKSNRSLMRDDSEEDNGKEDDSRTPPVSHWRSGY